MAKRVLLVNPWVHDFALYDLWMKPVGLLLVGDLLRRCGFDVRLLDCLDRLHPTIQTLPRRHRPRHDGRGCGKFACHPIPTPEPVSALTRPYSRYGVPPDVLAGDLSLDAPEAILVTSGMTYWYPGVAETIAWLRSKYPDSPILLGGLYATLCTEHAREHAGADQVLPGWDPGGLLQALGGRTPTPTPTVTDLNPAHELLARGDSATTLASIGCPHRCRFCASARLWPIASRRSAAALTDELRTYAEDPRIEDVAFIDDALLVHAEETLFSAMAEAGVRRSGLRFHTPNGLHARRITREVATALRDCGFTEIRLGLETTGEGLNSDWDNKVTREAFHEAVEALRRAGYGPGAVEAYVIVGLPDQAPQEVEAAVRFTHGAGVVSRLARFSPVPGSPGFEEAASLTPSIRDEPLLHNNTLVELRSPQFPREEMLRLRDLSLALNREVVG